MTGRLDIVGLGPGGPEHRTPAAAAAVSGAEVVIGYGPYVDQCADLLDGQEVVRGAMGEEAARADQALARAAAGARVALVSSGDAGVHGMAARTLARAAALPDDERPAIEVVPGVTAAHACAARIGLPVTLRERVRHFSVVTGATADGAPDLDWQALAAPDTAFAVYMGVGNAPLLRCHLLAAGADPDTPVVIVENGTREDERAFAITLADLSDCVAGQAIAGPAVIFVGLDWETAGLCRPETVIVHRRQHQPAHDRDCDDVIANAEALP